VNDDLISRGTMHVHLVGSLMREVVARRSRASVHAEIVTFKNCLQCWSHTRSSSHLLKFPQKTCSICHAQLKENRNAFAEELTVATVVAASNVTFLANDRCKEIRTISSHLGRSERPDDS